MSAQGLYPLLLLGAVPSASLLSGIVQLGSSATAQFKLTPSHFLALDRSKQSGVFPQPLVACVSAGFVLEALACRCFKVNANVSMMISNDYVNVDNEEPVRFWVNFTILAQCVNVQTRLVNTAEYL